MTKTTRFERLLLSATVAASVSLWGLWASAAPKASFDADYDVCDGLAGIAYTVALETGHKDADAAYEDTLAACMTSRGWVTP